MPSPTSFTTTGEQRRSSNHRLLQFHQEAPSESGTPRAARNHLVWPCPVRVSTLYALRHIVVIQHRPDDEGAPSTRILPDDRGVRQHYEAMHPEPLLNATEHAESRSQEEVSMVFAIFALFTILAVVLLIVADRSSRKTSSANPGNINTRPKQRL